MLNRIEIKTKAKKIVAKNIWNIWKPALLIYVSVFVLEALTFVLRVPFLGLLIGLVSLPLSIGFITYQLALVRGEDFHISQIFSAYQKLWVIVATGILIYVFTFLWSLLFVIPGIIAAYSYMMSFYLLADPKEERKESSALIRKSKNLMRGYKFDYFVFHLSFFGWGLLCGLTFGLAAIYVFPYVTIANTLYYEELRNKKEIDEAH